MRNTKKDKKYEHLLHCVNEDFDQRYLPVTIGLRMGPGNELLFLAPKGLINHRVRLVPLTDPRLDKSYRWKEIYWVKGQLDCLVANKKTISIEYNSVLVKLPGTDRHLSIYPASSSSGIRINHEGYWSKEIGIKETAVTFRPIPIDKGHGFEIVGRESGQGVQFLGYENPIPELGVFDMKVQLKDGECYLYDNRYLSVKNKNTNESRLEAYGKLSAGKSLKNGSYELKFG